MRSNVRAEDFKTAALCYVCLMNRNHLLHCVFFYYYQQRSNRRSGVCRCDSRGFEAQLGGSNEKNF